MPPPPPPPPPPPFATTSATRLGVVTSARTDGLAIEVGVAEQAGGITEVEHLKVPFVMVGIQAGAAAQYLFELRHRVYFLVYHYQPARLAVHTGGQQFGGGHHARVWLVGVDKVVKLPFALFILAGD